MASLQQTISHDAAESRNPHHTATPKEKIEKTFFDTNFFDDAKIKFLENEFGDAGPAYYMRLILSILREGGALHERIAKSFLKKTQLGEGRIEEFLEACLEIGLLYLTEDKKYFRSHRADREIQALHEKRESWRSRQTKHRDSPSVTHKSRKRHASVTRDTNECHRDSEEEEEHEYEHEQEKVHEREPERRPKAEPPAKVEHAPGVFLAPTEREKVISAHGEEFFNRCCEKLSAWIAQDPTPKRKRNGRNAAATFRVWVINAVSDEDTRRARAGPLPNGLTREFKSFAQLEHERKMKILEEICDDAN